VQRPLRTIHHQRLFALRIGQEKSIGAQRPHRQHPNLHDRQKCPSSAPKARIMHPPKVPKKFPSPPQTAPRKSVVPPSGGTPHAPPTRFPLLSPNEPRQSKVPQFYSVGKKCSLFRDFPRSWIISKDP